MAPRKRKAEQVAEATAAPARVTRSSAKRSAAGSGSQPVAVLPEEKKAKKAKGKRKEKEVDGAQGDSGKAEGDASGNVLEVSQNSVFSENEKAKGDASGGVLDASNKTIVIEHCKQCNSFKTRANMVKEGLEKSACGITVIVNPEKPRRGCFEIRRQGGKKFISLLDMKRPFKPMKDLDMDKVISDIIDEISSTS